FTDMRPTKSVVRLADGKQVIAVGRGSVTLRLRTGVQCDGEAVSLVLHDVLYCPSLSNNILSTNKLTAAKEKHTIALSSSAPTLLLGGTTHVSLHRSAEGGSSLLWLIPERSPAAAAKVAASEEALSARKQRFMSLHCRLGHLHIQRCFEVARKLGIDLSGLSSDLVSKHCMYCDVCAKAKLRKLPVSSLAPRDVNIAPGACIHADIKGELPEAYNSVKSMAFFVDEATRFLVIKEIKGKDKFVEALKGAVDTFVTAGVPVGAKSNIHTDSEGIFKSAAFREFIASKSMTHSASPPYAHELNGIVERVIQTVTDMARCLLVQAGIPDKYWTVAFHHAVWLRNRLPSTSLGDKSPYEMVTGKPASFEGVHMFGCSAFVRVDDASRGALDPKGRQGVYVGVDDTTGSHRVMFLDTTRQQSFLVARHCTIDDTVMPYAALVKVNITPTPPSSTPSTPTTRRKASTRTGTTPTPAAGSSSSSSTSSAPRSPSSTSGPVRMAASRDPLLDPDLESDDESPAQVSATAAVNVPNTYKQAMRSDTAAQWTEAIASEIASLDENGVFEYVPLSELPANSKPLPSRWVFAVKPNDDSSLRFKARLVARGDRQVDVDVSDIYAPVVNYTTLRAMFAVATLNDYELDQLDIVTAFLNGQLDGNVYLNIPSGLRLRRSLYGLRQSPRIWNETLHNYLTEWGLSQSAVDPCLYFVPGKLWVAVWVDDFLCMAVDKATQQDFKQALASKFNIKEGAGPVRHFLGLEIERDRVQRTTNITATEFIRKTLERFGMSECKGAQAPLPHNVVLKSTPENVKPLPSSQYPYRELIGSLNYLATLLRPDIGFAVSLLARFQNRPSLQHWDTAKTVLRYLKSTQRQGLLYSAQPAAVNVTDAGVPEQTRRQPDEMFGYADASWAEDPEHRRSQTGYVFMLANAAIDWRSSRQTVVALSSTEAEYLSLSAATREALYLRNLMSVLTDTPPRPVVILEDNQSTIKLAHKQLSSDRTKHIDIRHHFVKHYVSTGVISLLYVPTEFQAADCLTKPVDRVKNSQFRQIILG
ncbi:MAG: reverse transcriptase domain-containing protein, partial [Ktedonobacterales bacterium]